MNFHTKLNGFNMIYSLRVTNTQKSHEDLIKINGKTLFFFQPMHKHPTFAHIILIESIYGSIILYNFFFCFFFYFHLCNSLFNLKLKTKKKSVYTEGKINVIFIYSLRSMNSITTDFKCHCATLLQTVPLAVHNANIYKIAECTRKP